MSKKIGVFPGSFDPITKGHVAILEKAYNLFDEIIIAIGINSSKTTYFSLEERQAHLAQVFAGQPKIRIATYKGLTVDFCREQGAQYLIRGLRDGKDFEYEKSIAIMNSQLEGAIETVFFMTAAEYSAINSYIVRDVLKNKGKVDAFVPEAILPLLK